MLDLAKLLILDDLPTGVIVGSAVMESVTRVESFYEWHLADVERLLRQIHRLVDTGASAIVVEHDLHVIADSDWVIDLGPGAGKDGGNIVAQGQPEAIARVHGSSTGRYLKAFFQREASL